MQAVAEANAEATGAAGSAEEQRLVLSLGKLAPPVPTAQPVPDPAAATE